MRFESCLGIFINSPPEQHIRFTYLFNNDISICKSTSATSPSIRDAFSQRHPPGSIAVSLLGSSSSNIYGNRNDSLRVYFDPYRSQDHHQQPLREWRLEHHLQEPNFWYSSLSIRCKQIVCSPLHVSHEAH